VRTIPRLEMTSVPGKGDVIAVSAAPGARESLLYFDGTIFKVSQ
jgi:hypothetical protein